MKVDASPLAAACLTHALLREKNARVIVLERLEEVGRDEDWLYLLGRRYLAVWEDLASGGSHDDVTPVTEEWALLVSWLSAPLHHASSWTAVNALTHPAIVEKYMADTGAPGVPPAHRLGLVAGVVGRPVADIDQLLPAALPTGHIDADVALAYQGLVEHVGHLQGGPWLEMHRTAVLWRLGGIIQGIAGGSEDLLPCFKSLAMAYGPTLPVRDQRATTRDDWLLQFRGWRNALTHVRGGGTPGFAQVLPEVEEVDQIAVFLRLACGYTAAAINDAMRSLDPSIAESWLPAIDADFRWVEPV